MNKNQQPLFHIVKRGDMPWYFSWGVRGAAIVLALLACALISTLVTSDNPIQIFATIIDGSFGSSRKFMVLLQNTAMMLCVALALTPAFKMRFWNIGGEGQALAGAIACVAGNAEVFGLKYRYTDGMLSTTSYAWTGLQAALIAGLDPVGMFFVSIFLAGLQIGGSAIQRSLGIPLEIANIIQCCITLFVSVKITIRFVKKSKAAAKEGGKQA